MSGPERSISEDELQAYVDNRLDAVRHMLVVHYLETHPDEARRIQAYQQQRAVMQTIFASDNESQRTAMLSVGQLAGGRERRRDYRRMAAALVLGVAIGGLGGWFLHSPIQSDRIVRAISLLETQALSTHAVYSVDRRHPIEVSASDSQHLTQWLSARLNRVVTPPDLSASGYAFLGGRLLATERGSPAALLMYEDSNGHRLSIVLRPMAPDMRAPRFDFAEGPTNLCGWIDNGLGYAVVANLPDEVLDRITTQIKEQKTISAG